MSQDKPKARAAKQSDVALLVYMMKAQQALSESRKDIRRSMKCPSCDKLVGRADGRHVLYMGYVVISCNGYWVVDPNKLGFERPNWTPAKADESLVRGHEQSDSMRM